ncbi:carbohydrate ABC transporter permease [Leifsonia sp. F6_8S_P_1B]|uniref:Carbohydrate ABC transporter permease n=1 Tax=Leifsonia williamsii TaxID=3035919 RepID=A0ABT8K8G0_9MICO|nr:carbohydrate ABC transporter permease [Leifsonia williamsii]MDN4613734.1 carbohydrate ABC transporter permease [Leifsonia williamsii]
MTAVTDELDRDVTFKRPTEERKGGAGRFLRRLPMNIVIVLLLIIEIYPLIWILLGSFKTQDEFLNDPFWTLPSSWDLANYASAFTTGNLGRYILNSVLTVFPALFITLAIGVAAAFALEILVWKGRGTILLLFLAGIMVPGQMVLLPLFSIYFNLQLTGTLWPLIITYTASGLPLTVFMVATYFRAVPREMFEAATLDGAGVFRQFWSIGVPVVRNAIFTVGLVQFFFLWNDLLIALTFTNSEDLRTIQVGLLNFTGQYGQIQYGPLFAAICVSIFGTLLLYLFLNQRVMKGLAAGSVKG